MIVLRRRIAGISWPEALLVLVVCGRIVGVTWAALTNTHGDYYASLPGTYVKTVNPALWSSPDLQGAMGYGVNTYYHGPTQYLVLYPLAYLDSYRQIASVLLVVYALVLAAAFWCLHRALVHVAPGVRSGVPLFVMTFLFFPLLQSYLQREFEVVVFFGLCVALLQLQRNRLPAAAAALGVITWFKYVPLLFVGYLGLRGWVSAVVTYVVTSAIVLAAAHLLFGLPEFVNNNVPGHAAQVFNLLHSGFAANAGGELVGSGFCAGWFESEATLANVRHGLCAIASTRPWLPPHLVYVLLCMIVAGCYLAAHTRLSRGPALAAEVEAWRRALEFSVVTTVCACFFFAHYYYLIVLVIPFAVLLVRYLANRQWTRLALWAAAYVLVSALIVPTGLLSRLSGVDVWYWYIRGAWFLYGELLLMGLLLFEYLSVASRRAAITR